MAASVAVAYGMLSVRQLPAGLFQHGVRQLRVRALPDAPRDGHPVEAVDHGTQVHLAGGDGELRDVGEPLLVRGLGVEVARDEVVGGRAYLARIRAVGAPLLRVAHAAALFGHEAPHGLARHDYRVLPLAQALPDVTVAPLAPDQRELLPDGGTRAPVAIGPLRLRLAVVVARRREPDLRQGLRHGEAGGQGIDDRGLLVIAQIVDALCF